MKLSPFLSALSFMVKNFVADYGVVFEGPSSVMYLARYEISRLRVPLRAQLHTLCYLPGKRPKSQPFSVLFAKFLDQSRLDFQMEWKMA